MLSSRLQDPKVADHHGKPRSQLWSQQRGAGEDRAEVRPRPGAATVGLDICAVRGQPGEATARPRELPEVADGRNCEWPRVHVLRIEVAIQLLNLDIRLQSHLKSPRWKKFFSYMPHCVFLFCCLVFCFVFWLFILGSFFFLENVLLKFQSFASDPLQAYQQPLSQREGAYQEDSRDADGL